MSLSMRYNIFRFVVAFLVAAIFAPAVYSWLTRLAWVIPMRFAWVAIGAILYAVLVGGVVLISVTVEHGNIYERFFAGEAFSSGFWLGNIPICLAIGVGITLARNLELNIRLETVAELAVFVIYIAFELVDNKDYAEAGANFNAWSKIYHDLANYCLLYYLAIRALFTLFSGYGLFMFVVMALIFAVGGGIGWAIAFNMCRYNPDMTRKPDYAATHGKASGETPTPSKPTPRSDK